MATNTVMFGWKRSVPGREQLSAQHFGDFVAYLAGLQGQGQIDAFEPILLDLNASGIIGFFLIRAEDEKLSRLLSSEGWMDQMVRAMFHLEDPMVVRGASGDTVQARIARWSAQIPS